jgi:hypothetical protein
LDSTCHPSSTIRIKKLEGGGRIKMELAEAGFEDETYIWG